MVTMARGQEILEQRAGFPQPAGRRRRSWFASKAAASTSREPAAAFGLLIGWAV